MVCSIDLCENLFLIHEDFSREMVLSSVVTSLDLNDILLYPCLCGEQFMTNKTRNKHARTCFQAQISTESEVHSIKKKPEEINSYQPSSRGRGYIPPALKRAYQEPRRPAFTRPVNISRPPDAHFFLEDDDSEVAQAFGLALENTISKHKSDSTETQMVVPKSNLKVAAYPPKAISSRFSSQKTRRDWTVVVFRISENYESSCR